MNFLWKIKETLWKMHQYFGVHARNNFGGIKEHFFSCFGVNANWLVLTKLCIHFFSSNEILNVCFQFWCYCKPTCLYSCDVNVNRLFSSFDEFVDIISKTTIHKRIPFNYDSEFIKLYFGKDTVWNRHF